MTNREAVELIKANWPSERYGALRQALSKAIRALEREDRRDERANGEKQNDILRNNGNQL